MTVKLNREEFEAQTAKPDAVSMIEFYTDSCIPCKRLAPLLDEVDEANSGLFVGKVNAAEEMSLAMDLKVFSTPTLLFYKDGAEAERLSGSVRKAQLEETIAKYL